MKKNYKLIVEYDGSSFCGWQRQTDEKTIQEQIEKALSKILNQPIKINGSGRTDAGVHAYGQVASFHADTQMPPRTIQRALNSFIKDPIIILNCHTVSKNFHARYSAVSKEYSYRIYNNPIPTAIHRQYHWYVRNTLDIEAMRKCCYSIIGEFDFKSFESSGSPKKSTIRRIFDFKINKLDYQNIEFTICGNGFLKYMVRNLVGTIVLAGLKKINPDQFMRILDSKDRTKAGGTAPPHGLFLNRVNYS